MSIENSRSVVRGMRISLLLLLPAVLICARVIALDADPPPSLDWNPGIWTDEGFYTYTARNAVLFGRPILDEWNNGLLSPLVEVVQRAVFTHWGVSLVSARAVSVAASFLALAFFTDALRRWFGGRVALTGLLLLGGEATLIFYNRLALLETPALAVVCAALWALSWERPLGWITAGFLAAGAIGVKTTFLLFLPIPLLAWVWRGRSRQFRAAPLVCYGLGALVGIGVYLALWGIPHGAEIWRLNRFYATRQSAPHSPGHALMLGLQSVAGYSKGLLQFLETRTPVLTGLALLGLLAAPLRPAQTVRAARRQDALRILWLWALLGWLALGFSRYAPTRYYLVMYPALAGLAAHTLWRLPLMRASLTRPACPNSGEREMRLWKKPLWFPQNWRLGGFLRDWVWLPVFLLAYHTLLPVCWLLTRTLYALPAAVLASAAVWGLRRVLRRHPLPVLRARPLAVLLLSLFAIISGGQWAYWYATREYETRAAAWQLAQIVRPGQVIAGDWAPNLCLNNGLRGVPVLPDLANWRDPIHSLHPSYVLLTETPYPRRFWQAQAPTVVVPQNLVRRFDIHGHHLSLFRVPPP